jgi:predicted metalloenzyme YecM
MARIGKRDDVSPKEGTREYGDVEFADPTNKKYPIDTAEHVRHAWSYINKDSNAEKYSKADAAEIRKRIKKAAPKFGVEIDD